MDTLAASLMATVEAATELDVDFTPHRGTGPGAQSFEMLIGYAAWVGFRLAVVGFFISLGAAAFGRMQTHAGAEQFGKRGVLTALAVAVAIKAAGALFAFAAAIGDAA